MNNNKNGHWAKWAFTIFGGVLVVINSALTFAFGYAYLGASFGSGMLSSYAGAFYALLLFDIGYLAWFWTFTRTAESTGQRSLALGMSIFSLIGSLAATLQQLATNASALVDLSAYHQSVGMIALGTMLFMTTAHIIATAAYLLLDPRERVKQVMASARAAALDDSLAVAEKMIAFDHEAIINAMSADVHTKMLASLGFTHDVKHIGAVARAGDADYNKLFTKQVEPTVIDEIVISSPEPEPEDEEGGENFTQRQ